MSMRGMFWAMALCFSCAAVAACSGDPGEDSGESSAAVEKGGGGTVGGACSCTDAQGHSHSGTYTNDVDGLNCAGSWGSVACTDSSGASNGKCKSAAIRIFPPPVGTAPPVLVRE
jgi:hypothetical protein